MSVDNVDPQESGRKLVDGVGGIGAALIIIPMMLGMAVTLILVMLIPVGIVVDIIRGIVNSF